MSRFLKSILPKARKPALPEELLVAERRVPLEVREHPTARRITMRMTPGGGGVRLTVPRRTARATVLDFLERHRGWVEERLGPAPQLVCDGARLPFRGGALLVVHDPARRLTRLDPPPQEGGDWRLHVGGEPAHTARRVADALKREARRDLEAAVERHATQLGLRPRSISLKDTTSRWGSCTADQRLSFSWRIVMAPPFVLDYLVAHEMAHLREMNHGPGFWSLCRELCPGMDAGRAWLRTEGSGLHAVRFSAG
ncbi:metal-dependent hydrolase [Aureimonas ureilytica]|uniref:Metal-dependent hydrolase n=1 Tax=Aureimonas ureilytica TaxID=401562 RepID=A0A175R6S4_9HYPH|nr:M48 family metallopeptidase [Aureimonas ureilytica]KTQ88152.1 metal-dependent hydrolase [Aureimonas ureilytica]